MKPSAREIIGGLQLRPGADLDELAADLAWLIEAAAQASEKLPSADQVRREIDALDRAVHDLVAALRGLSPEARQAVFSGVTLVHDQELSTIARMGDREALIRALIAPVQRNTAALRKARAARGPKADVNAYLLAYELANVYSDATGLPPSLPSAKGGPFLRFVEAVLHAAGVDGSAEVIARKAVDGWRRNDYLPRGARS